MEADPISGPLGKTFAEEGGLGFLMLGKGLPYMSVLGDGKPVLKLEGVSQLLR